MLIVLGGYRLGVDLVIIGFVVGYEVLLRGGIISLPNVVVGSKRKFTRFISATIVTKMLCKSI